MRSFVPLLLLAAALLTGCGVVGIPPRPIANDSKALDMLSAKYSQADFLNVFADCTTNPSTDCASRRNQMIGELLFIVDRRYFDYEGSIIAGKAKMNFSLNTANLGLTTVATALTPGAATTAISGAASLLNGTKANIDKDFYAEQSAYALIAQMRADRASILADIETKRLKAAKSDNHDYLSYPVASVLGDIERYYRAGTLASAIQSIVDAAGGKAQTAQQDLDTLATGEIPESRKVKEMNSP